MWVCQIFITSKKDFLIFFCYIYVSKEIVYAFKWRGGNHDKGEKYP